MELSTIGNLILVGFILSWVLPGAYVAWKVISGVRAEMRRQAKFAPSLKGIKR